MNQIIMNINDFEERAALLEDGKLSEIFIQRNQQNRINGNIYKGRVVNILPGMEAAFLDIGLEKNAFLHIRDFFDLNNENKNIKIENRLKKGQEIIVQILKEPRDEKGARVTTKYTIPGKYMVLMPNNDHIAISQKISDRDERARLEKLIEKKKLVDLGVIIRTAASGKTDLHIKNEIEYLLKKWDKVTRKMKTSKVGEVLYSDNDMVTRTVRDVFSNQISELIIDNEEKYWEIVDYIKAFSDDTFKTKVKLFESSLNIFDYYGANKGLEDALKEKVWLECGGYLVIQKTEALISIDVNTGKNVGNQNLDETILVTNLEAAVEIATQLRIRNLSGIIIIDFIDMKIAGDQEKVVELLGENLKKDRIKNDIVHFTKLGLIEMTRKRQGTPLSDFYQEVCHSCNGTGLIKSKENVVLDIMREVREFAEEKDIKKIKLVSSSEIFKFMKDTSFVFLDEYVRIRKKEFILEKKKEKLNYEYEIVLEA